MSRVTDFINSKVGTSSLELLPLFHSCECFDSRSIIESNRLEKRECENFGEKLLYFFYGKPSYPAGEKAKGNRDDIEYCPVCFIVDPREVEIFRTFPFDSGAFKGGRYGPYLHRNMEIDDFELEPSLIGLMNYIKVFYGSNQDYIRSKPAITSKVHDPYVDGLISIHNATGTDVIDDRANTIEILSRKDLVVKKAVRCVILPEDLLGEKIIRDFLHTTGIEHIEYTVRRLTAPSLYNAVVFEKAINYMESKGGLVIA